MHAMAHVWVSEDRQLEGVRSLLSFITWFLGINSGCQAGYQALSPAEPSHRPLLSFERATDRLTPKGTLLALPSTRTASPAYLCPCCSGSDPSSYVLVPPRKRDLRQLISLHSAADGLSVSSHVILSLLPRMPSTLRGPWHHLCGHVRVELPRAEEDVRGHTQWFSKRLSNCKRGRQRLRGHALQALGSLPRCACAWGGLSPCGSRENAPFPQPADCRSAVNALWGPDLEAVGRSECPAMVRGGGRFSRCCAPLDPSFMAGVEDLPSRFPGVST